MREFLGEIARWQQQDEVFALATVVATSSSAPRGPGASVAVHADGTILGSVSGGCVEGAVVETCNEVLAGGPARLVTYGYSDDDAVAVGLTCGGKIDVFTRLVTPDGPDLQGLDVAVAEDRAVAIATVVDGRGHLGRSATVWSQGIQGTLGRDGLDRAVTDDARGMLAQGATGLRSYGQDGERRLEDVTIFIEAFTPRPRMLIFGAIDFATALSRVGRFLGFRVTVCDARERFATAMRFPDADEVIVDWPHRYLARTEVDDRTVICVLTHDSKFDVPVLKVAVETPAAYIGVLGSRRTHDARMTRLREAGVDESGLARLRSPIGLDLGGRTPEETALSIAAEIVQLRWGGSGQPLRETRGRIHAGRNGDRRLVASNM